MRAFANPERIQKYAVHAAIWLFVRDPQKLDEIEREDLAAFCQASAVLKQAYDLLQDFLSMVHTREGQRLDAWLARVAESGLPELQSFAAGVEKDKDAVKAGLTWPINNGMVEGHVTRVEAYQASNVWEGWICFASPARPSCGVTGKTLQE